MKTIQKKITLVISAIMLMMAIVFLLTSTLRANAILDADSEDILIRAADYYAKVIDDNYRSTEQSVATICNYAAKLADIDDSFLRGGEAERIYTDTISELSATIAENTLGAMAVYLRYNPEDFGGTAGFWYKVDLSADAWVKTVPTDMSLYEKDDLEHVGWYYVPVEAGVPMWMDPYHNANIGVDMISYIIPFYHGDYTVGIIGMDINLELLREATAQVEVYESGRAFLLDGSGSVIYHEAYPAGMAFSDLPEADQIYFSRAIRQGTETVSVGTSRNGGREKLILRELRNGMLLGVFAPLNEIDTPRLNLLLQQILIAGLILSLAIVICQILVQTITDPLKQMTAVAEHYAAGDFSEEMRVESDDEVGILSRSLQTMSASLQKQIEIADSASKAKSAFLANMSHELRTPIHAILGMNEMILRETRDDGIYGYAVNVQQAGSSLLSLVNSILDFSRIEDGKMELIPADYDTAATVNELVNSVREQARAKGLELETAVDGSLPAVLHGDELRLRQIIMNLLTNAVKYTETGKVTLTIRDAGREAGELALFVSVKDTGIGIRQEDLGRLSISFERIDEERNRSIEGSGLGIAIVNRLLEMMDSKLAVESVYGEGSEFSFTVRQGIVDETPIGDYAERLLRSAREQRSGEHLYAPAARILVVDDNEMNLKVARNLMKRNGILPDLASSGAEAMERIREKTYDIVFLDHMMPKMDGIETLARLREENLLPAGTAVIALTANAIVGARESYLAAGFDGYLSKPIEVAALEELLAAHLPPEIVGRQRDEETGAVTAPPAAERAEENPAEILEFLPEGEDEVLEFDAVPEGGDGAESAGNEDILRALGAAGIRTEDGILFCGGDIGFYLDLLGDFAADCEDRCAALEAPYASGDWQAYRILVHALKSTAKTVGSDEVSEAARALEDAAAKEDEGFLRAHHGALLAQLRDLGRRLADALAGNTEPGGGK